MGLDRLSRNVGKELPLLAVYYPTRVHTSCSSRRKPEITWRSYTCKGGMKATHIDNFKLILSLQAETLSVSFNYILITLIYWHTAATSHTCLYYTFDNDICLYRYRTSWFLRELSTLFFFYWRYNPLWVCTRVGTLIVATIYLQLIQNRYMFRSFTGLQCSHQHCVQPVASDVEVVGYI